ncbi:peptide/nickel transport system permease protein [Thermocatellispora tengchongensis]|uniref:Peptide/nickel transport system permease protein n=1 Tax=Thermocatellispora tengchongensis TaxID=1073253 RepID=A0A840P6B5_9ACTN|nr:peptide/nickel transport system permease protein [Thermocatellispora tengchongensis]
MTIALIIIAGFVLLGLFAPLVAPYDPDLADGSVKYLGPGEQGHLLGTDEQGRDILSRLIWGGRTSLIVALLASATSTVIGGALALVAGFSGDRVAGLIMRSIDIMFAFPVIIIALVLAVIFGPGTVVVVLSIVFSAIPYVTRVIFAEVKLQRGREYVEAAESLGAGFFSILFREVLPNVLGQTVVYGTGLVGGMIVFSSSLSALGIGVQPPTADWGRMISEGAKVIISGNVYPALLPGLVVLVVALAFNWLGDGLRDLFDPHHRRAGR